MPLEYNLDALGAISYSKGCYIGQELIARAHYQGVVRKRLMPATFTPTNGAAPASLQGLADIRRGRHLASLIAASTCLVPYSALQIHLHCSESNKAFQAGHQASQYHASCVGMIKQDATGSSIFSLA